MVTALASDLRDPSNLVFTTTQLGDFINEGVIEVGRLAPARFQQDIPFVANTLGYTLQGGDPEIEVKRVEVWDSSYTPDRYVLQAPAASASQAGVGGGSVGWEVWDGKLYIQNSLASWLDASRHILRVWGYGPYALVSGATEMPMSTELEWAVRKYARVIALESMLQQRNLFTQWQTTAQNNDTSPASLMQQLSAARADWLRLAAKIVRIRETA